MELTLDRRDGPGKEFLLRRVGDRREPELPTQAPEGDGGAGRRMRILFIADQIAPPVTDGSSLVYKSWLDALTKAHSVSALLFGNAEERAREAIAYLGSRCDNVLILPGLPQSRGWKVARALYRHMTGTMFAHDLIEEWGRGPVKRRLERFLKDHAFDVTIFSKLNSFHLVGRALLRHCSGLKLLDLHDDFVEREVIERTVLAKMLRELPELRGHPGYAQLAFRHRISRFSPAAAQAQEQRMLSLFDGVLVSSMRDVERYRRRVPAPPSIHFPWTISTPAAGGQVEGAADMEIGFLASDAIFNVEGFMFFHDNIWPRVRSAFPQARMLVGGGIARPLSLLRRDWPGIVFRDRFDDIAAFYERVRIVVVPLLSGTGCSLKTLEAMSFAKPIVSTGVGVRGITVRHGTDVLLAETASDMAEALLRLMRDPELCRTFGANARQTALDQSAESHFLDRFTGLVNSLTDVRATGGRTA